jgi:excisionase family DNA binding protein
MGDDERTALAVVAVWLTVSQMAARAQCSRKVIYAAVASGKLRAAKINQRVLRAKPEWVDAWLERCAPQEIKA